MDGSEKNSTGGAKNYFCTPKTHSNLGTPQTYFFIVLENQKVQKITIFRYKSEEYAELVV